MSVSKLNLNEILSKALAETKSMKINMTGINFFEGKSRIPNHFNIGGFSGVKIKMLLNKLLSHGDVKYLEVGLLFGSTFIPAIHGNNPKKAYAVDNWSEFAVRREFFIAACEDNLSPENRSKFKLVEKNFFETTHEDYDDTKFNIYFYDANHDYDKQYGALKHMIDIGALEDEFIFIVDDCAHTSIAQKSIKDLNLKILHEEELGVPVPDREEQRKENWYNGLYVSLLKK